MRALPSSLLGLLALSVLIVSPAGCHEFAASSPPDPADPEVPPPPGFVDAPSGGTRLKAVMARAGDGSTQFLGWRDTRWDVACTFSSTPEGETRCLPDGAEVASVHQTFYADASCTQRIAEILPAAGWSEKCAMPRLARGGVSDKACGWSSSTYRLGERVTSDKVYYTARNVCVAQTFAKAPGSLGLFRFEAIDPADLVRGSFVEGPAADGIVPVYVAADDGARAIARFRDAARGFDCDLLPTSNGLRCVPLDRALAGYAFADRACSVAAAVPQSCLDSLRPSIPFAVLSVATRDQNINRIFEGGERLAVSFVGSPSNCVASGVRGGYPSFAVGAAIPAASFVSGAKDLVPGPLGLTTFVHRAGGWSIPHGLRDSAFGGESLYGDHDCFYAPTTDGVWRCVPAPVPLSVYYSDDACTRPVVTADRRTWLSLADATTCPARVRVYARGDRYHAAVYQKTAAGACAFVSNPPPTDAKIEYYSYGVEVPPDRLVPVTRVVK